MGLYAINANATGPWNRDFSAIPVDRVTTVDDLVCPAPTYMMCQFIEHGVQALGGKLSLISVHILSHSDHLILV